LLLTGYSASVNAQVDPTTGNLINFTGTPTATTSNWNNGVYVNQLGCFGGNTPGNCGPYPNVRTDGNINFSYGQVNLNQIININKALEAGGAGVQLSGFNFAFRAKNGNGWDDGRQDYLDAYVKFYGAGGGLASTYDYVNQTNKKYNWTNFSFSETFANPIAASNYSNAQVGFIGKDNNYWAGPYGPEITNVSFSLKYRVDPCSLNPAYSPTCAGFNNIVTSGNLLNPDLMSNGNVVYNSFAINTALKSSGAGVDVYGFNYGYNYSLGNGTYGCTATNQDGSCSWWMTTNPTAQVRVRLTDSGNKEIYSAVQSRSTPNTAENVSYQFLLPSTTNSLSLGTFTMGANTSGNAAIQNMYANVLYKPDPCATNPLYSPTCPGYATAYAKNLILGSTVASASALATPAAASPALAQASPAAAPDPTQPQQQAQQSAPAQSNPAPAPAQDPNQNPSVAQDNPAQPSPQQAGPAPTGPQPAGGPPQTATASTPPPSAGPSQSGPQQGGGAGPSKLAMSVLKTAQANDKATQAAAVQQAAKAFEGSQASSQAASNLAISINQDMSANSAVSAAAFASQSTQASVQASQQIVQSQPGPQQAVTQTQQTSRVVQQVQQQEVQQMQVQTTSAVQIQQPQQQEVQQVQSQSSGSVVQIQQAAYTPPPQQQETQSTAVTMLKPPVPATLELPQQASSGTGLTISRNPFGYNPLSSFNLSSMMPAPVQTAPVYQPRLQERIMEVEAPQVQVASFSGLGRAGNPLSEMMMQQRFEMMQENVQQQTSSVNRNVQPNDLAGGVDLASMALQPKGFETYGFVLKDAAFYEPKEVYKGQTVIDNARALRQLSSDRLHKEMVDQQYK
jgi:hypothetical protein